MSALFAMLARKPEPGKVKPGLAECLGAPAAAKVYRSCMMDLCERFARLSVPARVLAYAPRGARKAVSLLASRQWRLMAQEGAGTGQALAGLFEYAWRMGLQRTVVLLSDCPTVPSEFIIDAFDRLLVVDVVLGPTTDGRVYLVGMSLERPELLMGIDWEGTEVFDALVDRIDAFGLVLGLVPHWYEVEDRAGLDRLASHLRALALMGDEELPRRTQMLLERLRLAEGE
ncbi:MAG: DUF2064 domain-containing protein [Planctomycetes bacterium]|nr:DUF2064 domain-containing protein [Planctomycetota bacterium]